MKTKVSLTIDNALIVKLDNLVRKSMFTNRSALVERFIERGVYNKIDLYKEQAKYHARMSQMFQDMISLIEEENDKIIP